MSNSKYQNVFADCYKLTRAVSQIIRGFLRNSHFGCNESIRTSCWSQTLTEAIMKNRAYHHSERKAV
jgi:hypothetical protein